MTSVPVEKLYSRTIGKIITAKLKCVRRIQEISVKDNIRNEEFRRMDVKSDIDLIIKQQIKWFGHITRQNRGFGGHVAMRQLRNR
jgi:hypothetical protein